MTALELRAEGYSQIYVDAYEKWLLAIEKRSKATTYPQFMNAQAELQEFARTMNKNSLLA